MDTKIIDLTKLQEVKENIETEKSNFLNNAYDTFNTGYLVSCQNAYVNNIASSLSKMYQQIEKGYVNILGWFNSYIENVEALEKFLQENTDISSGFTINKNITTEVLSTTLITAENIEKVEGVKEEQKEEKNELIKEKVKEDNNVINKNNTASKFYPQDRAGAEKSWNNATDEVRNAITKYANAYGNPKDILRAMCTQESSCGTNPKAGTNITGMHPTSFYNDEGAYTKYNVYNYETNEMEEIIINDTGVYINEKLISSKPKEYLTSVEGSIRITAAKFQVDTRKYNGNIMAAVLAHQGNPNAEKAFLSYADELGIEGTDKERIKIVTSNLNDLGWVNHNDAYTGKNFGDSKYMKNVMQFTNDDTFTSNYVDKDGNNCESTISFN